MDENELKEAEATEAQVVPTEETPVEAPAEVAADPAAESAAE